MAQSPEDAGSSQSGIAGPGEEKQARWRYYIDREFQNRFMLRFAAIILIVGLALLGGLWLVHQSAYNLLPEGLLFGVREMQGPGGEPLMCTLPDGSSMPVIRPSGQGYNAFELLWAPIIFTTLLNLALVTAFALFYSHSMAGPIYNIKSSLRRMIDTGELREIRVRRSDQFQDLAELLNEFIRKRGRDQ